LIVGTGKFASNELMRDALIASGTELVRPVALRRADLPAKAIPCEHSRFYRSETFSSLAEYKRRANATEAVRLARLGRKRRLANVGSSSRFIPTTLLLPDPLKRWRPGNSGEGGIHSSPLHQCRSGAGETLAGL
jgi:thiazole synthase